MHQPPEIDVVRLTPREESVLRLFAEELTTMQVGVQLGISPKTVEDFRLRIYRKLGIDNYVALTKYAIRNGLTSL